jgi:hypothetical protein
VRKVLEPVRGRHIRHVSLVFEAVFGRLERCREIQYGPAMLDRHDAAVRKAAAIAGAIDFVDDRRRHVAAAQEVGVQRMGDPALDRMLRGRQGLSEYLATKDLGAADVAAVSAKNILLDPLEFQQMTPVPLTNTASSLARNRATLATSTGSPSRRAAELLIQKSRNPAFLRNVSRLSGVMIPPGWM